MNQSAKRILEELAAKRGGAYTVKVVAHPNGGAYAISSPAIATFDPMSLYGDTQC